MFEEIKLNESFARHLIDQHLINEETALQALDQQRQLTQPIGRLALQNNILSMKQVFRILQEQADSPLRFGELAIILGYMDNDQLDQLLDQQQKERPGLCEVLFNLGLIKKGVLQKERRAFLRAVEGTLV